jgi:hypothetical protein
MPGEHRVARGIGGDGGEDMRRRREGGTEVGPGPDQRLHRLAGKAVGLLSAPRRADDPPAGAEAAGEGGGGIAVAKGEQGSGHGPTIRARTDERKGA